MGRPPILYHLEAWRVFPSLTTGPATRRASYPEAPGARLIASICRDDSGPHSFEKQERRSSEHMPQGRVKWYSAELGYGFILPYDGGTELLVRREDVSDGEFGSLEKSVEVTYEAVEGREGPEAKNIHKV